MKLLLLAGTTEAVELARLLHDQPAVDVVASLAGHTRSPAELPCPVRVGGFGGVDGLVVALRREGFDAVVDATHPYSTAMPRNAAAAAALVGLPHLRLVRPPWSPRPDDDWRLVPDVAAAAARVRAMAASCAFLTIGRLDLRSFGSVAPTRLLIRSIERPDLEVSPPGAVVLTERGPFGVEAEVETMRVHGVDVLVTKNSGGDDAKLRAARRLGVTIVMIARPLTSIPTGAATAEGARRWVLEQTNSWSSA